MNKVETVTEYIAQTPKEVRNVLTKLRTVIKKSAPNATEKISYGMPFYEYGGTGIKGRLVYFAAFKKHISLFITPRDTEKISPELKKYHISKATYQFPLDKPLPFALIEKTVRALVKERKLKEKVCSRGHTFQGSTPCPICYPGYYKKLTK